MLFGDAPAHRRQPLRGADTDDAAGDGVGGGNRDAKPVAANSMIEPPVSAQNPCIGVRRVIFDPIVFTMRQPPASVPSRHHRLTGEHHPERHVEAAAKMALRVEQHRDDAHGLLRIVAAVTERSRARPRRIAGWRNKRSTAERREAHEDPGHGQHQEQRENTAQSSAPARSPATVLMTPIPDHGADAAPWPCRRRPARRSARANSTTGCRNTR